MLKIQVTGPCGAGKTTIATIIEKALRDSGINVTNTDPDKTFGTDHLHMQEKRVEVIAKRSREESVQLETLQLRKIHDVEVGSQ